MNKVTFEKLDTNFLETIKDYKKIHLKPDEGIYYTILVDGQKAGVIGFKVENNGWPGLKIGIHQDFRGQGVFGLALDLLAKKHNLKEIYSEVAIANKQSTKAHQKVGFTRISIEKENELKEKGLVYKRNIVMVKKFILPGKEYEKIVAEIHRQFEKNAVITENEIIAGRQIDLAIRASVGTYPILIIVECKDYSRKVDIGKVDELIGKINDVKASQGVLVSNSGFSEKAIKRAKADGRIQLASVFHLQNNKLRTQIKFPTICDFRRLESYKIKISNSTIGPMRLSPEDITKIHVHIMELWNNGKLSYEPGEYKHHESDIHVCVGQVDITYDYIVRRSLFNGEINMTEGQGIVNLLEGSFTSKDFTIGLNLSEAQKNWEQVSEKNIPKHAFHFVSSETFLLPTSNHYSKINNEQKS